MVKHWRCDRCGQEAQTANPKPHIEYHNCRALGGVALPLVETSSGARVLLVERDDYVGAERGLTYVSGRPVMSIITQRPDGSNDCVALPGTAYMEASI